MVVFFGGMLVLLPAYYGNDSFLGNRVVSGLAEWVTSEQSPDRQDKSHEKAALLERFYSVGRAGWCKPAAWWKQGGYKLLV